MPDGLRLPDIPAALAHLWEWFCELSGARSGNGGGPNPISYSEVMAWALLTGRAPAPQDVRAIMALDAVFFAELGEQDRRRDAAQRRARSKA